MSKKYFWNLMKILFMVGFAIGLWHTNEADLYAETTSTAWITPEEATVNLSVVDKKTATVKIILSGELPEKRIVAATPFDNEVVTVKVNTEWTDEDGDGVKETGSVTLTAVACGDTAIQIYLYDNTTTTLKLLNFVNVGVKVGPVYTIDYDTNGGAETFASQSKYYGDSLTLHDAVPTKTGYRFLGWATSKTAESAEYIAGDTYTKDADATLYAVWQPITYNIGFNANGGIGAPANQTKIYGQALKLSTVTPVKTGYTFIGWGDKDNPSAASYGPGSYYYMNRDDTLTAVYEINTYTISYDANGGTMAVTKQTKEYGQNLVLNNTAPVRTGYSFLGWSTSKYSEEIAYRPGDVCSVNADITLYAVWKPEEYIISYQANGGDYAPASQIKYYDRNLTLSTIRPSREGYEFKGWNDNGVLYEPGGIYYSNKSATLIAVWEKSSGTTSGESGGDEGTIPGESGGNSGTTPGGSSGNNGTTPGGSSGNNGTTSGGTSGTQGTGSGNTGSGPKIQIITASSKSVVYKKGKVFSLGAKTDGDGILTYSSDNKKVVTISKTGAVTIKGYGKATITVTASATSSYKAATKKVIIQIVPKKMTLKKVSSPKKKYISCTWSKDSTVTGYQMYLCLRKDFKKGAYERTFQKSASSMKLKGLKSKKTYYLKIRAYKTVGKTKYYGAWSTVKRIRIK